MILIDTNVFSELTKPSPEPRVVEWLFEHGAKTLLSTVVIAELEMGIHTTRGARMRGVLLPWLERLIRQHEGRIVAFDLPSARRWGAIVADLHITERRSRHSDSQIAAQALVLGVPVATRNDRDFDFPGLTLIDPWASR